MYRKTNDWQWSRKTRTGALVLTGILFLLIALWRLLPSLITPKPAPDDRELQAAWSTFKKNNLTDIPPEKEHDNEAWKQHYTKNNNQDNDAAAQQKRESHPVPFDPNAATEEELISIGFPPRTAKTMIKYRSKGGKFRKKEDLQKLYTLSEEDYQKIAPYARFEEAQTQIPKQANTYSSTKTNYSPPSAKTVELNAADAEALMALRGIGPAFSKRIINFRNALGGFVAVEQLKEVYGFPDSTYQQLKGKVTADAGKLQKININIAAEEVLAKHPYIGRKLASYIIKERNKTGTFNQIEQLKLVPLINDEKYRKIAPYLSTH
jgi:competence protein ComEA